MTGLSVAFEPLVAPAVLIALALGAAVMGLFASRRGRVLRTLAVAALALALANPALVEEEREALPDVAVMLVDESESMALGDRAEAAEAVASAVRRAAEADASLELVEAVAPADPDGTRLFDALARALGEAPRGRLAGVMLVTDGQAHDAPESAAGLGVDAPVHSLIVGARETRDRRLVVVRAPAFGIVGERARFTLRIEDLGADAAAGESVDVTLSLDGGEPLRARARLGEDVDVELPIERRGPNVVEIQAAAAEDELTLVNNRAAVSVSGVRDRLRVLLITGEPHAGARSWRDLLKSDPSVDLVHFTILRPPDKQDGTPENELSLIRFPTQELFEEQLDNFDLVIFDRYRRRGVLRMLYLTNIANYVENGGALLIAAGPPFATPASLYRTPLSAVLPVRPTTAVVEEGFRPALTEAGRAHPVTAGLSPPEEDAHWGRWFRILEATQISGEAVLEGPEHRPLLVLDRQGEGRVAILMSDHAWLWARGFDGGGPHGELFRRLAHWLMQEPELDEERLTAAAGEDSLAIVRRTMGAAPEPATIITPSGETLAAPFTAGAPGEYRAEAPARATGLYSVRSGGLSTTAAAGPLNPREYADLRPTDAILGPVLSETGGGAFFVGADASARLPAIRRTRTGDAQAGRSWLGLARNNAYVVQSQSRRPLAPALLAVAIVLGLAGAAWAREGR